ncbi:MAG TPA: hypothetical protein VLK83_11690 [Rhodanobacteraceae bacterium]|nr:hypothetical protein [Rhodanobacteraceae bacterium]
MLEDLTGDVALLAVFRVHGNQDVPRANLRVVAFGFELGNSHADEPADHATGRCSDSSSPERGHDRTGGNERADTGNRERADASQPTYGGTDTQTRDATRGCAFGRLGVVLVREILGAAFVGQQRRDVVVAEAGARFSASMMLSAWGSVFAVQ